MPEEAKVMRVYKVGDSRRIIIPVEAWRRWGDPEYVVVKMKNGELVVKPLKLK